MTWQEALFETVAAFDGAAPQYGSVDCCQFIADYLERLGRPVELPEYSGKVAALRVLSGGLETLMTGVLGEPCNDLAAGGVVLAAAKGEEFPAVWNGHYVWLYHPDSGVSRSDAEIIASWK